LINTPVAVQPSPMLRSEEPDIPLMGIPRYVLVAFPIFLVLGLLARKKLLFAGWLIMSIIVSLILCALFVSWRFVA
jgi:hypothetical protein